MTEATQEPLASYKAGMIEAAEICDVVAKKNEGKTKDHPVNWARNCAAFIRINANEMSTAPDLHHIIAEQAAEIERLWAALENIDELNMLSPDENGHRWANSDLINQEIVSVRINRTRVKS